jgi:hypothetical protein
MKTILSNTRVFALLFIFSLFAMSCNAQYGTRIKGNGKLVTQNRSVGNFDELSAGGSFEITLVNGKEGEMTITADENLMEYIETEVDGGILKIRWKKNYNISTSNTTEIKLAVEQISGVTLSGSGGIESEKQLVSENFQVTVSGSSDVDLDLEVTNLKLAISGSGNMDLNGKTNHMEASISGSGEIDAKDLDSKTAELSVSGSGDIKLRVSEQLKARVSGSGDIEYSGNPKIEDVKVSGSGEVKKV